ncbi:MAG TPA: hypothetical protein PKY81_15550 [bacterium]|nr:hypothetical protein [bacterium]HPN32366.1 hypothetical protein [bacterium]
MEKNFKTKNILSNRGVMLLELLITIIILGVIFVRLIYSFNHSIQIFIRAREVTNANYIAKREMELLKMQYKHIPNFSPVSSSDLFVADVMTNEKIAEYSGWKFDMIVENADVAPNSQSLSGRLKKISLKIYSPKNNIFSYVSYFTPAGNNN